VILPESEDFGTQQQEGTPPSTLQTPTPSMPRTAHDAPHVFALQSLDTEQRSPSSRKLRLPAGKAAAARAISSRAVRKARVFLEHAMRDDKGPNKLALRRDDWFFA
jgi:hypothetical protein